TARPGDGRHRHPAPEAQVILVHYHEIALKGGNRARFERALCENLERALAPLGEVRTRVQEGRIFVETDADPEAAVERAADVFGVAHAMRTVRFPRDLEAVGAHLVERVSALKPASFRVTSRRNDKRFPLRSIDVDRQLGAIIHEATGVPVS